MTDLLERAVRVLGSDMVRPAAADDLADEVLPRVVVEPADEAQVGEALAWASRERLGVLPAGGKTKLAWGPPPERLDVLLSLRRLSRLVAHRHGDLTATLEAGLTLAEANAALARHGQWLPLDPPFASRATLGGIVATNDSGPRRHRHGTPRDLLIGVGFVRSDGRAARAGGIVVKNVAGYDLGKLLAGSFGSLAVLTSVSVKLAPRPPASRTVTASVRDVTQLTGIVGDLARSPLEPSAVEVAGPPWQLFVRYETIEIAAREQAEATLRLMGRRARDNVILDGEDEAACWREHDARPWNAPGVIVRVSLLPAELGAVLALLAGRRDVRWDAAGRAGCGVLLVGLDGPAEAVGETVHRLRQRAPEGRGSAVVLRAPAALRAAVDVWGPVGDGLDVMRAIKARMDPAATLNPGRGPGGL